MRLSKITVPHCGALRDFQLELPASTTDLQIVYADNEGGKSTLLRSLQVALFGFPDGRKKNAASFSKESLSGATVTNKNSSLSFLRKKGGAQTLLDSDQNTIPNDLLDTYLGSVSEEQFSTLFGLTTEVLKEGARALQGDGGNVATTLFSASLGIAHLSKRIGKLEEEAEILLSARKNKETVKNVLSELKELKAQERDALVSVNKWKGHKKELAQAKGQLDTSVEKVRELERAVRTNQTKIQSLKTVATLDHIASQLEEYRNYPDFSTAEIERIEELNSTERTAKAKLQGLEAQINEASKQLQRLEIDHGTLKFSPQIDQLASLVESYQKSIVDSEKVDLKLEQVRGSITDGYREFLVSAEEFAKFEPLSEDLLEEIDTARAKLKDEKQRYDFLKQQIDDNKVQTLELEDDLKHRKKADDTISLEAKVEQISSQIETLKAVRELEVQLTVLESSCATLCKSLDFSEAVSTEGIDFQFPDQETIYEYRDKFQTAQANLRRLEESRESLESTTGELEEKLEKAKSVTSAPTQEELELKRRERDQQIESALSLGDTSQVLHSVHKLDALADSRFDCASELAVLASCMTRLSETQVKLTQTQASLELANKELEFLQETWQQLTKQYTNLDLTPPQFLQWGLNCRKFEDSKREATALEVQITELRQGALPQNPADTLGAIDELLYAQVKTKRLLQAATKAEAELESSRKQLVSLRTKKAQLQEDLRLRSAHLATAEKELLQLTEDLPKNVRKVKSLQDLLSIQRELSLTKEEHLTVIDRFESQLAVLKTALKVNIKEPVAALAEVRRLLSLAEQTRLKHEAGAANLKRLELSLQDERTNVRGTTEELAEFAARLDSILAPSLSLKLSKLRDHRALLEKRSDARTFLSTSIPGLDLDDFIQELSKLDESQLRMETDELTSQLEFARSELDELRIKHNDLCRKDAEFRKASSAAADFAQRAEFCRSKAARLMRRLLDLERASKFLRTQIEKFQREQQSPILKLTGDYFSEITNGEFSGVIAQTDDNNQSHLIGRRSNNENVRFEEMSEGTAVQLYLALRLAALERHLETHTPFPLILDDVLMTFDDDRTRAVLKCLQRLAQKTQVIVLTHHRHVLDLAGSEIAKHQLAS